MKPNISLSLISLFTLFSLAYCDYQHGETEIAIVEKRNIQFASQRTAKERESITFILGEDKSTNNPYYTEATYYYSSNKQGKTTHLVNTCRSLLEARDYLAQNTPSNKLPWGLVNLVSHGNEWLGLSAKVAPEKQRTTVDVLEKHIEKGTFQPLPSHVLDEKSEIFIHGCGIGNNPSLIAAIGRAFGGKPIKPKVRASKLYEYYTSLQSGESIKGTERYLARAWNTNFKTGYQPSDKHLVQVLNKKYPKVSIDWQDALSRKQPRWVGDTYHYTFEVPVKWVTPLTGNEVFPDLSSNQKIIRWLNGQNQILASLDQIDIPTSKFNWWARKVYVDNGQGKKIPAVWLKGYCTIITVLQALTDETQTNSIMQTPYQPDLNDAQYYYSLKNNDHLSGC